MISLTVLPNKGSVLEFKFINEAVAKYGSCEGKRNFESFSAVIRTCRCCGNEQQVFSNCIEDPSINWCDNCNGLTFFSERYE